MLIAVVSDTHREEKYIKIIKKLIKDADILIHLGDNIEDAEFLGDNFKGEVYIVAGNCDFSRKYPKDRLIEVNEKKIFLTHGDLYGVKMGLNNIYYKGKEIGADIVLFGHTHQAFIEETCEIILMNPGSPSLPRLSKKSIGFIKIENGDVEAYLKEIQE